MTKDELVVSLVFGAMVATTSPDNRSAAASEPPAEQVRAAEAMDEGPAHRSAAIPGLSCAAAPLSTVHYPSEILPYDDRLHLRVAARCAGSSCDMASNPDCAWGSEVILRTARGEAIVTPVDRLFGGPRPISQDVPVVEAELGPRCWKFAMTD